MEDVETPMPLSLVKLDKLYNDLSDAQDLERKLARDIEVERASLEKMMESSDKQDATRRYYEKEVLIQQRKVEEVDRAVKELEERIETLEDPEEEQSSLKEKELEEKAERAIQKLQREIELVREKLAQDIEAARTVAVHKTEEKRKVGVEKAKKLRGKITDLKAEKDIHGKRIDWCYEEMARKNIAPITKRLATMEEKKKQNETTIKELNEAVHNQYVARMMEVEREKKQQDEKEKRERAKQMQEKLCRDVRYGSVLTLEQTIESKEEMERKVADSVERERLERKVRWEASLGC